MNPDPQTAQRNFRYHLIEGSLYLASFAFLNIQVVYPALVHRLGGGNIAVGALPVLYYLCYFFPQVFAANLAGRTPYRRPWVLSSGIIQRLQILLLAILVIAFGLRLPSFALVTFFLSFGINQIVAGISSPIWFDFLAKTTVPGTRGKLMGMRSSIGASMGFFNSLLLTALLTYLPFPWDYGTVFFCAFLYQFASWIILRKVSGEKPSPITEPIPLKTLTGHIGQMLKSDVRFRKFLLASALSTIGITPVGFFAVAALQRFSLPESYVGYFTVTLLAGQVAFGALLGMVGDRKGHKAVLLLCAASTIVASIVALVATHVLWFFVIFALAGLVYGMEMITRYNFASECATDTTRALYIGIMNAWLAPFYVSSILGGMLSDLAGYPIVFAVGGMFAVAGFFVLWQVQDPRTPAIKPS